MQCLPFKITSKPVLLALIGWVWFGQAQAESPSFDCAKVRQGSIEEIVCQESGLSALDRKLAEVYKEASKKSVNEHPPMLKAEQRGWIKGRNECWKSDDRNQCIEDSYRLRIAELQARYRLAAANGPITYVCTKDLSNEVVATFFQTDPPTLIAERGDQVSFMTLQPSGSGSRYQGRNESLWEHGGEAIIQWGYESPELTCTQKP